MAISKVIFNGVTQMDVTQDTVAANKLLSGETAHKNDGTSVTGSISSKSSSDLTASGATVTAPAGYYASSVSKTVSSGSATTPATTITANPSISVSSGGLITATASATKSITPTVSAGYVSSGTAGTVTVSGSNTSQLTTQGAQTITPTASAQTIASGKYLTGNQTIEGVVCTNLTAANIVSGVTVKVGTATDDDSVVSVTGTVNVSGGGTLTVATKTATMSAVGQTLSFTGLSGTPKYWFVKTTSQISSSGSTTIYYITDGFWDGTSVKGNSFRIGSTRRIYSWTSGVTQSYSGGTLTITGGSATGSSPGQFFNGNYELTYVY